MNSYAPTMTRAAGPVVPLRAAGQAPRALPRKGLTVLATLVPAKLTGPTPESARDAGILRVQRPALCGQLMALAPAQRAIAAERAANAFFAHLVFQPSLEHKKNVATALQAQCLGEQLSRKVMTPGGPSAQSGEGGNATQPDLVLGLQRIWEERTERHAQPDAGYQILLPQTEATEQRTAGVPVALGLDGAAIFVTPAASIDEREFRSYGEHIVSQMGALYEASCLRVGQAQREQAFVAALAEIDRYLGSLDPELLDVANGRRNDVTNRDANYLNFRVGNDRYGSRGSWDARTWLMNVRDRAARRLVALCARPAPPLVTYSVKPMTPFRAPPFFRR